MSNDLPHKRTAAEAADMPGQQVILEETQDN
jgi:hypothetical protein